MVRKKLSPIFARKNLLILFSIALLIIFIRYHLFLRNQIEVLEEKVVKLEQIVGPKKLLCDERESVQKTKQSLVRIVGRISQGSGFFFDPNGYILTNYHVIAADFRPKIILPDNSIIQGEVVSADRKSDLALVKVDKRDLPILEFGDSGQIEPMEELISLGYPYADELLGEPTVIKGEFVALRFDKETGLNYIQTDMSLNSGASGGPMINVCGEVVGINVIGGAGLSMGIASNDFVKSKWGELVDKEEPLAEVEKIEFNPNGSPKECVEAFYNYQTIGELKKAYELLSREYTTWTFDQWKEGYQNTLNIILYEVKEVDDDTVFIKFSSADFDGEDFIYRYFEGTQRVKKVNGEYKLAESNIKEVQDPGWEWFFPPEEESD